MEVIEALVEFFTTIGWFFTLPVVIPAFFIVMVNALSPKL